MLQDASRPVVNVSYAIDRAVWGPSPFGFHVTNVLLHMLNVTLLFELVRRVMGRRLGGFIAAALLAVHPMMTQSVGYISARPELLCTTFFLLALGAARRWMLGGRGWWLAATFASWILAVASKETAVVFVAVVLLYDYFVLRGTPAERRRRLLGCTCPPSALTIAAAVGRLAVFLVLEHRGEVRIDWSLGLLQLDVFRRFVTMLLMPGGQAIVHELSPVTGWLDMRVLSAFAVLGVMRGFSHGSPAGPADRHARSVLVLAGADSARRPRAARTRGADGGATRLPRELRIVFRVRCADRAFRTAVAVERAARRADYVPDHRRRRSCGAVDAHAAA